MPCGSSMSRCTVTGKLGTTEMSENRKPCPNAKIPFHTCPNSVLHLLCRIHKTLLWRPPPSLVVAWRLPPNKKKSAGKERGRSDFSWPACRPSGLVRRYSLSHVSNSQRGFQSDPRQGTQKIPGSNQREWLERLHKRLA